MLSVYLLPGSSYLLAIKLLCCLLINLLALNLLILDICHRVLLTTCKGKRPKCSQYLIRSHWNAQFQLLLAYLERNLWDWVGLSTIWCVIPSSLSRYVAPTPHPSSHDATPPKLRMIKVRASRGVSLERKNLQSWKRAFRRDNFSSALRAFSLASCSSG